MRIAAKWLFILCLPTLLLTASISGTVNSLWLYNYGSQEYGVSQDLADAGLELSDSELEEVYAGLISYFNSGEEYVSLTLVKFTPEEIIHFQDVKGLIQLTYRVLLGTLTYALVYFGLSFFLWQDRRRLACGLLGGGCLTLVLILTLVLLNMSSGFGQLFYQFHLLFFSNEFWSAKGYMLRLFPEGFFYDAAVFCALVMVAGAVILGGVGGWLLRSRKLESQ